MRGANPVVSLSTTAIKGETMRRIQLLLAAGAATVVAGLALNVSTAGAVTFHDHWKGKVVIDYRYGKEVFTNLQKLAKAKPPAVGVVFGDAWSAHSTQKSICTEIDRQLAPHYMTTFPIPDWTCRLPATGDLEAALTGPNQLELEFKADGVSVSGNDPAVPFGGATIRGTFDLTFQVTLDFASPVDGTSHSSKTPVTIDSSQVSVSHANFTSANIFVSGSDLATADAQADDTVVSGVASQLGLSSDLGPINRDLNAGAGQIWSTLVKPGSPDANELFNLSIAVGAKTLTVTYSRQPVEAMPVGCLFYADAGPAGTGVEALCSPHQPKGVTTLLLQDHTKGAWRDNPLDTTYEPGAHPGPEWSYLNSNGNGWTPSDGPDSGFAPYLVDYPALPKGDTTVEMRVCSYNAWGLSCDPGVDVHGYTAGSGGGSGGGGGGGGGGAGAGGGTGGSGTTPGTTPPGGKRHCGEAGVYCAA